MCSRWIVTRMEHASVRLGLEIRDSLVGRRKRTHAATDGATILHIGSLSSPRASLRRTQQ